MGHRAACRKKRIFIRLRPIWTEAEELHTPGKLETRPTRVLQEVVLDSSGGTEHHIVEGRGSE